MSLGPRLDLRQSQSLVMTPQLRQAIQLLQYSNIEVAAFVEQELERNPLLERDDRSEHQAPERPAPDQIEPIAREPDFDRRDAADLVRGEYLPGRNDAPLEADNSNRFDYGTAADGAPVGRGGSYDFDEDERGTDSISDQPASLRERLSEQLRLNMGDRVDLLIGAHMIALLDGAGRLSAEPAAVAKALGVTLARVEAVRARMLRFDPVGLFARSLQECLAAQLAESNRLDPAMAALLENLPLLAKRDLRQLMAICGVDAEDLADMIAEIRRLDPKPGATLDDEPLRPVIPDVLMRRAGDGAWLIEINPETMPRVLVNRSFHARITPGSGRETRAFIAERLQTANWLVKSLEQRAQTILKVVSEIVRHQDGFFLHGVGALRPLTLREIADAVEMHESTVSRVTANKYIATPRGTLEIKYFFTTAIGSTAGGEGHSAEAVRHRIRALIEAERSEEVLSDDAIVLALRSEGVDIARRTVAKYREALRIPSSVRRKREKAVPV
jgi:RNA polymerase sigma-54 factor